MIMREICLARMDRTRPVVVLTREVTIKGLCSEVRVGKANGLDHESAIALDNVLTIPVDRLGRSIGFLTPDQEKALARAFVMAYDLELPVA